jgi:hypothetical protein
MNRTLLVPGVGILVVFLVTIASLQTWTKAESHAARWQLRPESIRFEHIQVSATDKTQEIDPAYGELLTIEEVEATLTALTGEYLAPWREWENSPSRLYSRVSPRPIPTILAKVEMSPTTKRLQDRCCLATITVTIGKTVEHVPCMVDRADNRVLLCADGRWQLGDHWLKTAPLPHDHYDKLTR